MNELEHIEIQAIHGIIITKLFFLAYQQAFKFITMKLLLRGFNILIYHTKNNVFTLGYYSWLFLLFIVLIRCFYFIVKNVKAKLQD